MKLTKCVNGHFYDEEKYSSCPHCAGGAAAGNGATEPYYSSEGMSFAGGNGSDVTEAEQMRMPSGNENPTMPMFNSEPLVSSGEVKAGRGRNTYNFENRQNQVSEDDGKTKGIMAWGNPIGQERGAAAGNGFSEDPVVGWLVCIEGKHCGKAFELHGGRNFIGRDPEMDICLSGDNTIARRVHGSIIYEPKQRKFFAQPGEARSLFYVNEEVVLSSVELKDRDVIVIGNITMVFVPFCDETYGWGI